MDGDGLLDLYVANVGPNVLYRNLGGGRFEDITETAGAAGSEFGVAASFLDIDGDGDQDLFVVNYVEWAEDKERDCKNQRGQPAYCAPGAYNAESRDTLLLNRGDGTFEDVSEAKGLREGKGNGLGLVWGQLDEAPGLDVYVANDGNANRLWSWREDGPLADRAMVMGCALSANGQAEASMGVRLEDLDRDGSWDLMLSHIDGETNTFYMGGGRGYRDRTSRTGTTSASLARTGFGMGLADFDHDGWLDLYVSNGRVNFPSRPADPERPFAEIDQLFRGTAGARFEDLGPEAITGAPLVTVGRAAAFGDIDGDGDVDVCTLEFDGPLRILRNVAAKEGGAAVLSVLERDGNAAVGAVVIYELAGKTVRRQVQRTYSYCAANGPDVHVGSGARGRPRPRQGRLGRRGDPGVRPGPGGGARGPAPGLSRRAAQPSAREHAVEGRDDPRDPVRGDDQRRFDLQHVRRGAVGADEDAVVAHAFGDVSRERGPGLAGLAVRDEVHAEVEAAAAHVADRRVALREGLHLPEELRTPRGGVLHQALVVDDAQHLGADGDRHVVATEGREELHAAGEGVGDLARRRHRRHGVPVPDGLAHGHDVGTRALLLEGPHVRAHAAERDLDLVGDGDAAGAPDRVERAREVALGRDDLTAAPMIASASIAAGRRPRSRAARASARPPRRTSRPRRARDGGHGRRRDRGRRARRADTESRGARELVVAARHRRVRVAVVAVLLDEDVLGAAGGRAREAQRDLVRLGAAGHEVDHLEVRGSRARRSSV